MHPIYVHAYPTLISKKQISLRKGSRVGPFSVCKNREDQAIINACEGPGKKIFKKETESMAEIRP